MTTATDQKRHTTIPTCTDLVPLSAAVDVQALAIFKQIDAKHSVQLRGSVVAAIKARLANLSIESAVDVLRTFKYGKTQLCLGRNKWIAGDLLKEKYFPNLPGRLAKHTPVFWFYGGPPSGLTWYKGTLQTVVNDRILCEINENGPVATARMLGIPVAGV